MTAGETEPKVVVEGRMQEGIETTDFSNGLRTDEAGRLADKALPAEILGLEGLGGVTADEVAFVGDPVGVAVDA